MERLRIIFAASGEFAVPTLEALLRAGHEIVLAVSQPDRPAGRGRTLTPTPAAQRAIEAGLPLIRTDDINALDLPPADVMVVIAFGQKLSERVINGPRLSSINLHSSRLPRYRGAAPINWAILSGDTHSGNSVIRLAQKMDAGAILAQSLVPIGELETAGELHDRLALDGAALVLDVLQALATGTATETEQDHSQATLARKLSREASRIDWQQPAQTIACQIRGMHPWPGCRVELVENGAVLDTLTLVRARPIELLGSAASVGSIVRLDSRIAVVAGDARGVEVVEVQPAGKRAMTTDAYRRGKRMDADMMLRSI
jgi:methionyl-tRNA formyltransferase